MHKVRGNYSNCRGESSENVCRSSGGAQGKGKWGSKEDEAQFSTRNGAFLSFTPPSKTNVLFLQVFLLNLTRFWTKLRVLVPCFPDFIENSNVRGRIKS